LRDVRVLVTGASGFVGRHLVPRLAQAGFSVTSTDRELDVTDTGAVDRFIDELAPDAIVHLAAQSSVQASFRAPELTYRVNYLGSRNLLEAALRRRPATRFLLVSTSDIYGSAEPGSAPFCEDAPLRPRSPYSRTKAAADLLAGSYRERGLDVLRIRPFNHTGPGQLDAFVLPSFARQVAMIAAGRIEPVMRVGNLDSVRDFLDIDDVIEAYLLLLTSETPPAVCNVARGAGVRVGDALDTLCSLAGIAPTIEVDPERFRPTDVAVGDASRLRGACGWEPRVSFAQTLERLLGDWQQRVSGA